MAAPSKILFANGYTLLDISNDTVTPDKVLEGYTFHGSNGEPQVGTASGGLSPTQALTISTGNPNTYNNFSYLLNFTTTGSVNDDLNNTKYYLKSSNTNINCSHLVYLKSASSTPPINAMYPNIVFDFNNVENLDLSYFIGSVYEPVSSRNMLDANNRAIFPINYIYDILNIANNCNYVNYDNFLKGVCISKSLFTDLINLYSYRDLNYCIIDRCFIDYDNMEFNYDLYTSMISNSGITQIENTKAFDFDFSSSNYYRSLIFVNTFVNSEKTYNVICDNWSNMYNNIPYNMYNFEGYNYDLYIPDGGNIANTNANILDLCHDYLELSMPNYNQYNYDSGSYEIYRPFYNIRNLYIGNDIVISNNLCLCYDNTITNGAVIDGNELKRNTFRFENGFIFNNYLFRLNNNNFCNYVYIRNFDIRFNGYTKYTDLVSPLNNGRVDRNIFLRNFNLFFNRDTNIRLSVHSKNVRVSGNIVIGSNCKFINGFSYGMVNNGTFGTELWSLMNGSSLSIIIGPNCNADDLTNMINYFGLPKNNDYYNGISYSFYIHPSFNNPTNKSLISKYARYSNGTGIANSSIHIYCNVGGSSLPFYIKNIINTYNGSKYYNVPISKSISVPNYFYNTAWKVYYYTGDDDIPQWVSDIWNNL